MNAVDLAIAVTEYKRDGDIEPYVMMPLQHIISMTSAVSQGVTRLQHDRATDEQGAEIVKTMTKVVLEWLHPDVRAAVEKRLEDVEANWEQRKAEHDEAQREEREYDDDY